MSTSDEEEAIERTRNALADLPSGPCADETLALIQAAAWDEGYMACLLQVQIGRAARNPYAYGNNEGEK